MWYLMQHMTKLITCPEHLSVTDMIEAYYEESLDNTLFLAGGISGCPNWQDDMISLLDGVDVVLFNPRREDFDTSDASATVKQIKWEHEYLEAANMILFWFPCETMCPITLYELGKWTRSDKKIFVGVHPEYQRRIDVIEQTSLERPDVVVVDSIESLAVQVITYLAGAKMK
jgi:hypothetical protein